MINNVDLDKISQTTNNGKNDKSTLRKPVKLQGEWNLNPTSGYQFFATIAASQGVRLTRLNASVECGINFAKTFDVADEPITEGITFRIIAESDNADKSELRRLLKMAEERCPAHVQYDSCY